MTSKMVDYNLQDLPYRSYEKPIDDYSLDIAEPLRSLRVEIKSFKEDNERIIHS